MRLRDLSIRRWLATGLAVVGLVGAAAGCAGGAADPVSTGSTSATGAAAVAYPVTVGSVTLAARPTRIISLSPTATEMLYAVDADAQVVAVDDQSNYPADAPKTDLSGFTPNAEAIAAKNPDLVIISNDTNKITAQLTTLKIPVFLAPAATTLADTYTQLTQFGTLTDHVAAASALITRMQDDIGKLIKDVPTRATPLSYYYELDPTLYSVTSRTFVGSLFAQVGLVNIADAVAPAGNDYPQLSAEVLVKANPDLIFLADSKCCQQSAQSVGARAGWSGMTAVKDGHVVSLDDDIASRWGPRVVDLLRTITDAVARLP